MSKFVPNRYIILIVSPRRKPIFIPNTGLRSKIGTKTDAKIRILFDTCDDDSFERKLIKFQKFFYAGYFKEALEF